MAKTAAHPSLSLVLSLTALLALPAGAGIFVPLQPQESWYVTDGEVRVVVENAGATYIGGDFRYVGPHTGGGVAFKPSDGFRDPSWPLSSSSRITVATSGAVTTSRSSP